MLDAIRDVGPAAVQDPARRDIQKCLIERQAFDNGREFPEDREYLPRHRLVMRHAGRDANQLRAASQSLGHGHCGVHTELPDFVTRGCDNAPIAAAADDNRSTAQFRIITLLHRRIEGVHVDMQDRARFVSHRHAG